MSSAVKDVMTTNVVAVRETAGYKTIVIAMRSGRMSAFPVLDAADRVVGVVSEADLLLKEARPGSVTRPGRPVLAVGRRGPRAKAAGVTASELMSTPPVTIGPDASVAEAARLMYERGVKRLLVVDGVGRLAGIVSRADVLSVFTRPDSQIRDDVIENVIAGEFALNPNGFEVTVTSGIVTIAGQVERRAIAPHLIGAVRRVEGVVGVRDRLSYPHDPPNFPGHFLRRNRSMARG
ncbi:MAG: CBS domain-containing protein [Micromonosporaceae bacterium]